MADALRVLLLLRCSLPRSASTRAPVLPRSSCLVRVTTCCLRRRRPWCSWLLVRLRANRLVRLASVRVRAGTQGDPEMNNEPTGASSDPLLRGRVSSTLIGDRRPCGSIAPLGVARQHPRFERAGVPLPAACSIAPAAAVCLQPRPLDRAHRRRPRSYRRLLDMSLSMSFILSSRSAVDSMGPTALFLFAIPGSGARAGLVRPVVTRRLGIPGALTWLSPGSSWPLPSWAAVPPWCGTEGAFGWNSLLPLHGRWTPNRRGTTCSRGPGLPELP